MLSGFCIVTHARTLTLVAELEFSDESNSDENYGTPQSPRALVTLDNENISAHLPPDDEGPDDDEEEVPPPPSTSVPLPTDGEHVLTMAKNDTSTMYPEVQKVLGLGM